MSLQEIQALVQEDLSAVSEMIQAQLQCDIPLVSQLCQHIFEGGGKRLRPLVVILGAKATDYQFDKHIPASGALAPF